jgi:hypothetical protein
MAAECLFSGDLRNEQPPCIGLLAAAYVMAFEANADHLR